MKLIDLEQGSDEWLEFRSTRLTATDFAVFMASKGSCKPSFQKSLYTLLNDKVHKVRIESNAWMERGKYLEPIIRDRYNLDHLTNYRPAVGVDEQNHRLMASFDGWIGKYQHVLEIKTTSKPQDEWDELVLYYVWQVEHQMHVNESSEGIIIIVDAQSADNNYIFKIYQIKTQLTREVWLAHCLEFLEYLDNWLYAKDDDIRQYCEMHTEYKQLEEKLALHKATLIQKYPNGLTSAQLTIDKQIRVTPNYKGFIKDQNLVVPESYNNQTESYIIRVKS